MGRTRHGLAANASFFILLGGTIAMHDLSEGISAPAGGGYVGEPAEGGQAALLSGQSGSPVLAADLSA